MSGENEGSAEQQDPGTAQEQIEQQVALEQMGPLLAPFSPLSGMLPQLSRLAQTTQGGGAGYEFDMAQADAVIEKLEAVKEKALKAGQQLRDAAWTVQPPAQDPPSTRQANQVRTSLQKAEEHNNALRQYADAFITNLREAKKAYANTEQSNAGSVQQQM